MRAISLMKQHSVLSYCALVMLWSFSWWSLIPTVGPVGALFDLPMNPTALGFMLVGAAGPSLVGIVLTRMVGGKGSARALLARLGQWRVGAWWLAPLIPYVVMMALFGLYVLWGDQAARAGLSARIGPALGIGLTAALFEEFGWRGFLLPQLQQRYSPLVSALLVGLVWGGIWHLYGDYLALGNRGWWAIALLLVQAPLLLTAHSVLLTWVYNYTRGSLLLCVLFHFAISSSAFIFTVAYPSNASFLAWSIVGALVWWVVAGAVVLLSRRPLMRRSVMTAERRQYAYPASSDQAVTDSVEHLLAGMNEVATWEAPGDGFMPL
jgi:membrane protease YdiL (CAAX protease family)